ncbi:SDR family NAD(P)-dependent oxidoreductase [Smaragdicoccus niigatensis]|uniref:SDR family NAD(P)-dependent oxidoreductase n=1 Tax=Smaragdicoccus niigatensis TaxID=359359 RepID=UPI00037878C8|nr:SDR family oxidoreductase [Smaragdicoccus niigatensis]
MATPQEPVALITGAASGIGAQYARTLANRGYDLVLVDRDKDRLVAIADEIEAACHQRPTLMAADLATVEGRAEVADRLQEGVRFLVNSAGFGLPGRFWTLDPAQLQAELDVAVTTVMQLTRAALPPMIAAARGDIVSLGSIAGLIPGPMASYSASKGYVITLAESLAMTLSGTGVRVQALCPGFVRTRFHETASMEMKGLPDFMWLDVEDVVKASLKDLDKGKVVSVPGIPYKVMTNFARYAPKWLAERVGKIGKKPR